MHFWPFAKHCTSGYPLMRIDGKTVRVTRVICEREHGPPPTDRHVAAHSCANGHLACISKRHLRWATPAENAADTVLHGNSNFGERQWQAKLTAEKVKEIRARLGTARQKDLANEFGVSRTAISAISTGRNWTHA